MNRLTRALLFASLICAVGATTAKAATFEVNLTTDVEDIQIGDSPNACDVSSDPGSQCSLRAAIQESNATTGKDLVEFSIPGVQAHSLTLASPLPPLNDLVVIDGFSQPGSSPNTRPVGKPLDTKLRVEIDGTGLDGVNGFNVNAEGSTVKGLSIVNFGLAGVSANFGAARVQGNFLGITPGGEQAGNEAGFVSFESSEPSTIGGTKPAHSNLIYGNSASGVYALQGVVVQGNTIALNGGGCICGAVHLLSETTPSRVVDNTIEDNVHAGIATEDGALDAPNLFSRNAMARNELTTGIGIDLGLDGLTPNDPAESDSVQNFPALASAKRHNGRTVVGGKLKSKPHERYRIEIFEADGDTSQGRRFLGFELVKTDSGGTAKLHSSVKRLSKGAFVTATATRVSGGPDDTSEFSYPKEVAK